MSERERERGLFLFIYLIFLCFLVLVLDFDFDFDFVCLCRGLFTGFLASFGNFNFNLLLQLINWKIVLHYCKL